MLRDIDANQNRYDVAGVDLSWVEKFRFAEVLRAVDKVISGCFEKCNIGCKCPLLAAFLNLFDSMHYFKTVSKFGVV